MVVDVVVVVVVKVGKVAIVVVVAISGNQKKADSQSQLDDLSRKQ